MAFDYVLPIQGFEQYVLPSSNMHDQMKCHAQRNNLPYARTVHGQMLPDENRTNPELALVKNSCPMAHKVKRPCHCAASLFVDTNRHISWQCQRNDRWGTRATDNIFIKSSKREELRRVDWFFRYGVIPPDKPLPFTDMKLWKSSSRLTLLSI